VAGRFHLSEEDERAERDARDRLRHGQSKLRELRDRRGLLLEQIQKLSDEQHVLHDHMAPERERVEDAHAEYRELGRDIAALRSQRDALRPRLDAALAESRTRPAPTDRRAPVPLRPDAIRREMASLELRQQTQALSIPDENALITRLRSLRKDLDSAEKVDEQRRQVDAARASKEESFHTMRAEFERLGNELQKLKSERDGRMTSMRTKLAEVGQEIGQIREKARARGALFEKVEDLNRQMVAVDRDIREALTASRARRQEARETISEYNRSARSAVGGQGIATRAADDQFERLMKNGKVTLGG
jgi:uncharacterized coiled-coil DUF342 family protein